MKKRLIATILILGLVVFGLAGCQKDDVAADTATSTQAEESATSEAGETDVALQICSGCELEKVCSTYTVDGVDYVVCDDCYPEFESGMLGGNDIPADNLQVCSGCEIAKVCSTYTVDGVDYVVCDDCYPEFESGMLGGNDIPADNLQVCSGCEIAKVCGTYTVDGVDYVVCDDCYDEFATGMGLK